VTLCRGVSESLDDVHDVWHARHEPRETLLMPHRRRRAAAAARLHRRPHRHLGSDEWFVLTLWAKKKQKILTKK